jgi:Protein of unknown function (DUF3311)
MSQDAPSRAAVPEPPRSARSDRSAWYWLLAIPLLTVLYPPLYNHMDPELFGIPFFYWYQLAMVAVGVACTLVAYRMTRARKQVDR